MKQITFILLVLFMFGGAFAKTYTAASSASARVDYIIDGDTFGASVFFDKDISAKVRVRMANIDTPEIKGQCQSEKDAAIAAKNRLGVIMPVGSVVDLTNIKDDKYLGRIDANVFDASGNDVGLTLIKERLGRPYDGGRRRGWCE